MSTSLHRFAAPYLPGRSVPTALVLAAGDVVLKWLERRRERRALERLDDSMLRDIGLSRADIQEEVGKPFWRP
jgi:uncharacterized protein YjiS (DUF1127 family)